jgi:predicted RNA binding protein YcfA (HicA-like mRNA interferase family)
VRLPAIKPKQVIKALERAGFVIHRIQGSHYQLYHPTEKHLRVTVPYHNKDLKRSTLHSIIRQSGMSEEEFQQYI